MSKNSVLNGGWDERRCVEKILRPLGGIYVQNEERSPDMVAWLVTPPPKKKVLNKFLNCLIDNFVLWGQKIKAKIFFCFILMLYMK